METEAAWQDWAKKSVASAFVGLWDAGRLQREARGFVRDVAYDKLDELAELMRRNRPKEQRKYLAYKLLADVREEEA